jgi:predicted metal-dependent hydrolase
MPILQIGETAISYIITRSSRAKRQRIVVTAGEVEVIAPDLTSDEEITAFIYSRRRWVFDTRSKMLERQVQGVHPSRYVSGAKVPFRGRQVRLRIEETSGNEVTVNYRNGFLVQVSHGLTPDERDRRIEETLHDWMKARLRQDIAVIIDRTCKRLGLEARGFRLREQKHLWGTCGKDGILYLNWHLIFVPKPVLEYAVVHEVCHLKYRDHSPAFWGLVHSMMPDYSARKKWLDQQHTTR